MAAFADLGAAETRARAKMLDGTWLVAHAARTIGGTVAVRLQRPASPSDPGQGGWVEVTSDTAT